MFTQQTKSFNDECEMQSEYRGSGEDEERSSFHENCFEIVDEFAAVLNEKISKSNSEDGLYNGLKRIVKRLRRVETTSALTSFLHTQGTAFR